MNVNYIPVVVKKAFEHDFPSMSHFKLKAPCTITMLQFVDKIRARLKLPTRQAVHFVLEKGLPVGMSQKLKSVYQDNRNQDGLLYLTWASENTFGCIPPYKKPIKSKFPGTEALPFGAPEPVLNVYEEVSEAIMLPVNEEEAIIQAQMGMIMESAVLNNWFQMIDTHTEYSDQYDEPWPSPDIINNLPVPVQLQSTSASIWSDDFMEYATTSDIEHVDVGHIESDDDSEVPVYLAQFMASELIDTSEEETSGEEA